MLVVNSVNNDGGDNAGKDKEYVEGVQESFAITENAVQNVFLAWAARHTNLLSR